MNDKLLQVRISQELANKMEITVSELKEKGIQPKITVSELIRQSVENWIDIYNKINEGQTYAMLKTEELELKDLTQLNDILLNAAEKTENKKIKRCLVDLEDRLTFEIPRIQQKEKKRKEEILKK